MNKSKFKKTEVGIIPEDWEIDKLENYCNIIKKKTVPGKMDIRNYIGLEHIEQQSLRLNSIGSSKNLESDKFEFKKGQILFGKLRPYFRKVYRPNFYGVSSTDITILESTKKSTNGFMFYFLANKKFIDDANNSSSGTKMPRANWDYLLKKRYAFPPLPEQKSIAHILSTLDEKIEILQKQNKTLEEIGQTIFKRWFVDFEFPDENGNPYKSSGGKMVYSEELGKEIPEGWDVEKLGDCGEFKNGINYLRNEEGDTEFSIVNVRDIANNKFLSRDFLDKIELDFEKSKDYILKKRDILIARSASPGEVSLVLGNCQNIIYSGFSIRYRLNKPENWIYFFLFLQTLRNNFANFSTGTTLKSINQETLKNMSIILPDEKSLQNFNEVLEPTISQMYNNMEQIQTLSQIRDSLLPKLMSGKIRVPVETKR